MQAHQLTKFKKNARRIGRGGKRGSYSGRGIKGQKSRAGRRIRPAIRDIIKKIHKRRGYGRNRARSAAFISGTQTVTVSSIARKFKSGSHITLKNLMESRLVRRDGKVLPLVKIVGSRKSDFNFTFDNVLMRSHTLGGGIKKQ